MIRWLCQHKKSKTIVELRGCGERKLICVKCYLSDELQWPEHTVIPHSTGKNSKIFEKFKEFHEK